MPWRDRQFLLQIIYSYRISNFLSPSSRKGFVIYFCTIKPCVCVSINAINSSTLSDILIPSPAIKKNIWLIWIQLKKHFLRTFKITQCLLKITMLHYIPRVNGILCSKNNRDQSSIAKCYEIKSDTKNETNGH